MLKNHITATALNLFSLNGIKKVSMTDVAQNSGVSKRTLYDFFENKEALLLEVLEVRDGYFRDYYKKLVDEDEYTALEILLLYNEKVMEKPVWFSQAFYDDIKRYPKAYESLIQANNNGLTEMILLLKKGVEEGMFLEEVNFDIIAFVAREHMSTPPPPMERFTKYTYAEVNETFFWVFMRGISTDEGRKTLEQYALKRQYKRNNIL